MRIREDEYLKERMEEEETQKKKEQEARSLVGSGGRILRRKRGTTTKSPSVTHPLMLYKWRTKLKEVIDVYCD